MPVMCTSHCWDGEYIVERGKERRGEEREGGRERKRRQGKERDRGWGKIVGMK